MSKFDQNWIKDGWEKLCTNKQTDKPTDTTKIMVTWPWTKNRHLRTIAQLCQAISATKACNDNRAKIIKQQYLLHVFLTIWWTWPTNSWELLASLGHHSKFQPVSLLGFVTAPTSLNGGQQNFAGCLAVSWAGTLYIHFGAIAPNGILPAAKFTLCPSLAFSYIGSVTARHSSSGHQPSFVAW